MTRVPYVMMQRIWLAVAIAVGVSVCATAQTVSDYEQWRQDLLGGYREFREGVLTDYSLFMEGVWSRYEAFTGRRCDDSPKPAVTPSAPPDIQPEEAPLPTPTPSEEYTPGMKAKQSQPATPTPPTPAQPGQRSRRVAYKDIVVNLPEIAGVSVSLNQQGLAAAYRDVAARAEIGEAVKALKAETALLRLPQWWVIQLALHYGSEACAGARDAGNVVGAVLLNGLGYDARIALADNGTVVLMPFEHMVYQIPYIQIDGASYYFIGNDGLRYVYTFEVPPTSRGTSASLVIDSPPLLPARYKDFTVTDGRLTITGQVDAAMMERLRDYPQMPIPGYAVSTLQPDLRREIVEQVKAQIQSMSPLEAANAMLSLMQHGFEYATDDEQFGYE